LVSQGFVFNSLDPNAAITQSQLNVVTSYGVINQHLSVWARNPSPHSLDGYHKLFQESCTGT
jgi:hypothetical protein